MTCIIAIEHEGRVLLGSDSFLGGAMVRDVIDRPKYFRVNENFAIGFAGGLRPAQVLEHEAKFPKQRKNQSDEKYLVNIASAIRSTFEKQGALLKDEDTSQQTHDSLFIFALNGKAYIMQEDFSIIRSKLGCCSIGAGQDYAMGAMLALAYHEPEQRAKIALDIATQLSPMVSAPHHFLWV